LSADTVLGSSRIVRRDPAVFNGAIEMPLRVVGTAALDQRQLRALFLKRPG
jgi:hypothetical protein